MILQCFLQGLRERGYRAVLPPSGNAANYASQ
jgi:hypothetical protein